MKRGYGLIPDAPDPRDALIGSLRLGDAPPAASLAEHACTVLDQGSTSSCVGFAAAQAIWIAQGVAGLAPRVLAHPLAVYHDARRGKLGRDHVLCDPADRGCSPRLAWASLRTGIVSVSDMPIDLLKVDAEVPWNARRLASDREWLQYYRIDETGEARCSRIRQTIASGRPVCLGFSVDDELQRWAGPWPWQRTGPAVGRHYVCAVGYAPEYLVIVNSWSSAWGMSGVGLIAWPEVAGAGTTDVTVPVLDLGRFPELSR